MHITLLLLHLLALQGGSPPAPPPQDGPSPLDRARAREEATAEPPVVLGPDGAPLVPGALPVDASPEARDAWNAVVQNALAPDPVRAFELEFYLLQRGDSVQVNETTARVLYLQPGYVRSILRSGRQHLRGPQGDWLIDGEERVRLVGREGAEDLRQIDEAVGIARNFIALTDPASVRMAWLELAPGAPPGLPPQRLERASQLRWIALTSPDFRLYGPPPETAPGAPRPTPLYAVLLGVDPSTHTIEQAVVRERDPANGRPPAMLFVDMAKHERRDGFLVPREIRLHELERGAHPQRFRAEPTSELKLKSEGVNLRPELAPTDFVP